MDNLNSYAKILLDLIYLRETNYDEFMNRLFEALTGEYREAIHDNSPVEEKTQAIRSMIKHFEKTEEFEKCAKLQQLIEELKTKPVKS